MPRAIILGGTGQIGQAVSQRLIRRGWDVAVAARRPSASVGHARFIRIDRDADGAMRRLVGNGADLLLDCIAFDASHAAQVAAVASGIGRVVTVSSASVYRDAHGRTLDEAAVTGFPDFGGAVAENHPTVAAGPATYSTRKVAMEQALTAAFGDRATILRPCAIHGPHSKHAREWWVLKRLLDGRPILPLAFNGESRFQTTSTAAIADAVELAVEGKAPGILNVRDPDTPSVREIAQTIMDHTGYSARILTLAGPPDASGVGKTPWSAARPFVTRSSAPASKTYAQTVGPALDWLMDTIPGRDWRTVLPQLAAYPRDHFDYAAEDAALQSS